MPSINELIKMTALGAFEESKPTAIVFGKVISIEPLKINVEQKLTLTAAQLILTDNVRDYYLDMTVEHLTEDKNVDVSSTHLHSYGGITEDGGTDDVHNHGYSGETNTATININLNHNHAYSGRKKFLVHQGLKVDEEVIMLQMQGGQKYVVLNRVVKA